MNDEPNPRDNRGRTPGEPSMNWRGLLLLAIAIAFFVAAIFYPRRGMGGSEELSYPAFIQMLDEGRIVATGEHPLELVVEEGRQTQFLRGFYRRPAAAAETPAPDAAKESPAASPAGKGTGVPVVGFRTPVYMQFNRDLEQRLGEAGIVPTVKSETNVLASALVSFIPIALFLVVLYFLFRQQIRGALNFGKSKARLLNRDRNKTTFRDVAGVEEAKEDVLEIVEFLKDPKKFQKLGGRIPKGVLIVGPRAPARPSSPRRSPARPTSRSSASAAPTSWKCSSVSAPAACATCSNRARNRALPHFHR
jgi:cell division protease FtsH